MTALPLFIAACGWLLVVQIVGQPDIRPTVVWPERKSCEIEKSLLIYEAAKNRDWDRVRSWKIHCDPICGGDRTDG